MKPHKQLKRSWLAGVALLTNLWASTSAFACSVCFGNPDSDLAKGATAGVIVLGLFVYLMVFSILGIGAFWYVRARRLAEMDSSTSTGS